MDELYKQEVIDCYRDMKLKQEQLESRIKYWESIKEESKDNVIATADDFLGIAYLVRDTQLDTMIRYKKDMIAEGITPDEFEL